MSFSRPDKNQQGVTLVELMVAMVLSLFLIAGVIQVYLSNTQVYRMTEASSRVQENARFAFRFLTKDIRMAGYQGCAGQTMTVTNTLNDNASFLYDFGAALKGFEAGAPDVNAAITSPLAGSDIIVIRGMFGSDVEITGQPSNEADCNNSSSHTAVVKVSNASGLSSGDIVVAGNCTRASIFQITAINPGGNLVHNTGVGSPGNNTKNLAACYAGNGELQKITTTAFYIRNNAADVPSLYRKDISNAAAVAQELVEGVENMQITYGIGSGVNNLVEKFVTADAVDDDWSEVISVRINLLMRSIQNNITTKPQTYTFNGSAATASDRRLHRVFTTTIALRNRLK